MLQPPKLQGEERGDEGGPGKISPEINRGERTVTGRKRGKERRRGARKFRKLFLQNTLGSVHLDQGK